MDTPSRVGPTTGTFDSGIGKLVLSEFECFTLR